MQKFFKIKSGDEDVVLPEPKRVGSVSIEEAIESRRSVRTFEKKPVTIEELSQILWAGQGEINEAGKRTAPSAGATYPIELYVVVTNVNGLKQGIYYYNYEANSLKILKKGKFARQIRKAALDQESVENASLNIIVSAQFSRTESRYGSRAKRYVFMECGHVGQNIQLQATAIGLGSVIVGAFRDDEIKEAIGIKEDVLYVIPVGRYKSG